MAQINRPKSLTETVLEHLREQIVSGAYELGAALSERQLAEELNVSKTPVRESLVQLKTEGLVTILPQRGAFVFTLSAREVIEICEFRIAIEMAALHLAIKRDRAALVADITGVVDRMGKARAKGDAKEYLRLDSAFHAAFFSHCGNHYLKDSYDRYVGKIAALRTHLSVKPMHTKLSFEEHKALRDVLADGSDAQIAAILEAHIGRTRESYAETVEDIAAADAVKSAG
ncbi:GntR family transcriptional regulator [Maliponia aquimaris]|uniref:HTH-type transcriptional regulator McbR n=1 Tax=Maliponia aquimaris TaxID=1673631 RepID=A0A238KYL7_9RHOB|nr:GntR family transcriptional regulator [Maliponia aquimaris]SMX47817.1 HTH-type transcriptional regulator McbR [Maliponia aquimaris]